MTWKSRLGLLLVGTLMATLWGCNKKKKGDHIQPSVAFEKYISAYTPEQISRKADIRIVFRDKVVDYKETGNTLDKSPISFSPSIDGKAKWETSNTLLFEPDTLLPSDELFTASIDLDDLIDGVPDSLETFQFTFQTKPQSFGVSIDEVSTMDGDNLKFQQVKGHVETNDFEPEENIEKILSAELDGDEVPIIWFHDGSQHTFTIEKLERKKKEQDLVIEWDGDDIGVDSEGEVEATIKAIGDFTHTATYSYDDPQQIVLEFSDPLKPSQNLEGLIKLDDNREATFAIEGNQVKIFPRRRIHGTVKVNVFPGLVNVLDAKNDKSFSVSATFSDIEPKVEIVHDGTIIPKGKTVPFIFKAVSLNAVDVRVIKISEQNIPQFLQVNRLSGDQELKRVGQVVMEKKIALDKDKTLDLSDYNKHVLDLNDLVKTEPGAIYEIALGFRPEYSLFTCSDSVPKLREGHMLKVNEDSWNSNGRYYYHYYREGSYHEADNACKTAYYNSNRVAKQNVLASNLGLLAKKQENNKYFVAVTDLITTAPLANVELEFFDFQQYSLKKVSTGQQGVVDVQLDKKPYLVVARRGKERSYLRLDDGDALSLSTFNISGERYFKGIKGHFYTERGVWRPGDTIYTTFVLEDKKKTLPPNHPVTFEFYNPQGDLVTTQTLKKSVRGFYRLDLHTDMDDPTGSYLVKAHVGGTTFNKSLKVETIRPNRLKINLEFDKDYLSSDASNKGTLDVKWLHGAVGANLKADVTATLTEKKTMFEGFEGYAFDDPFRKFEGQEKTLFEGKTDANGKANVTANLSARGSAPGMLNAHIKVKAFEPGGNFSKDNFSVPYHPYENYVGIAQKKGRWGYEELLVNEQHDIPLVVLDRDGKPVANKEIEVELYRVRWSWWWDSDDDDLTGYNSRQSRRRVSNAKIKTDANGRAVWKFKFPDDRSWGRFVMRACLPDGHCTGKVIYPEWPSWYGTPDMVQKDGATMLNFQADKAEYTVGDEVKLSIPASEGTRALITIESGTNVLEHYWMKVDKVEKGMVNFSFPAKANMAPYCYASISLLQPHAQTKNDLPIRMYGVLPIKVTDPKTQINPVVDMPDVLRPEEKVTIKVKEEKGQPMTYTLAVVDEGLLDLTRFRTPDLWKAFYKKQALTIKNFDLFNDVAGAEADVIKSLLGIGGDGEAGAQKKGGQKARRFKPMVKFIGPFYLEAHQTQTHSFKMPNYVGSVRTMVVAGNGFAYGSSEKTTPVKKPLMILGTLPRVLGPEETVDFPVTVFAMEDKVKNVKVNLKTNSLFTVVDGKTSKSVSFDQPGDKIVTFKLRMKPTVGIGKVNVTASSGNKKAHYDVELNVRNPNPMVTDVYAKNMMPNTTWDTNYTAVGMTGTNKAVLEVSALPPINLEKRLEYLIRYPYGCVEQTTSSVFPQLYLGNLLDLKPEEKARIEKNVNAGIERLRSFQTADGGLSYWPSGYDANYWGTNYAGHFLVEAKKAGYHVPETFLKNWENFQKRKAQLWRSGDRWYNSEIAQAYRLYLLALNGTPETGAMNRLRNQGTFESDMTKWYLASAYQLTGQPQVAKQLIEGLSTEVADYRELSYSYGSTLRDQAIILQSLTIMKEHSKASEVAKTVAEGLSSGRWYSTQATAYSLVAMAKFANISGGSSKKEFKFAYRIDEGQWQNVTSDMPLFQIPIPESGKFEVKNEGTILYPRLVCQGIPLKGDETNASNGLQLELVYRDMDGKIINPKTMQQGRDFMVEAVITNPTGRQYKEMALTQIFPSGWEIHNSRMDGQSLSAKGDRPTYKDVRDDRVNIFFDLGPNKSKKFVTLLNSSYQGEFYMPTVTCEAMYDKKINARQHGNWVEIKP